MLYELLRAPRERTWAPGVRFGHQTLRKQRSNMTNLVVIPRGVPGLSWAVLGSFGRSWAPLGASWVFWEGQFWGFLGSPGRSWPSGSFVPGRSWDLLGFPGLLWEFLGSPGSFQACPRSSRTMFGSRTMYIRNSGDQEIRTSGI